MPLFLRALRPPGCPVSPHGWGFPPSLQVQRGVSPGEQERAGGTASGPGEGLRGGWGVLLLYLLGSGRVRPAERWRFWKRRGASGGSRNPGSMRPPPAPRQDLDPALDDDTCQGNGQTSHRLGAGVRERHIRHRTVTQIIRTTLKTRPENKQPDCKKWITDLHRHLTRDRQTANKHVERRATPYAIGGCIVRLVKTTAIRPHTAQHG